MYIIEVSFDDGRPTHTVYRRFRDFEALHKKACSNPSQRPFGYFTGYLHNQLYLFPQFGKAAMSFRFPATSSGTEGVSSGDSSEPSVKRRSSVERLLKKNENKWDYQFHLQRYEIVWITVIIV